MPKEDCPDCDGTGQDDDEFDCPTCDGTGTIDVDDQDPYEPVLQTIDKPFGLGLFSLP
jgi:DnaJ-class molecular chaperone